MESLDEKIANSKKDIFMLQTEKEALDFWMEPARVKLVTFYMQGCGWCHRFVPEYIKLAPTKANSDLLFGAVSRNHVDKIVKFIPNLRINGYPTTLLLAQQEGTGQQTIREMIPGFMTPHALINLLESKCPELKGLPTLQYLQNVKMQSLAEEAAAQAAAQEEAAKRAGGNIATAAPAFTNSAQLPSSRPTGPSSSTPPGLTAGSGTIGEHALPQHLRQPPPTPNAPIKRTAGKGMSTLGGRKHKSKHHRHQHHHHAPAVQPTKPDLPAKQGGHGDAQQDNASSWCVIL